MALNKDDTKLFQISKRVMRTCGAQILTVLAGSVMGIVLARLMGAAEYGTFTFGYSLLVVLAIPCKGGLDTAVMKYGAEYTQKGRFETLAELASFSLRSVLIRGGLLMAVTVVALGLLQFVSFDLPVINDSRLYVPILFTLIPISLLHIAQYLLYGQHRTVAAQIPEAVLRPIGITAIAGALFFLGYAVTAVESILLNLIMTIVSLGFAKKVFLPRLDVTVGKDIANKEQVSEWREMGKRMFYISALNFILSQSDTLLLGTLAEPRELGIYSAAAKVALIGSFFYAGLNSVLAPMVSGYSSTGEIESVKRLASLGARLISLCSIGIFLSIVAFQSFLMGLFGAEFLSGASVLVLLSFSQLIKGISGIGGFLLSMGGHEKDAARWSFWAAITSVAVSIALIPQFGGYGAAVGNLCASIVWSVGTIWSVRKRMNFWCIW